MDFAQANPTVHGHCIDVCPAVLATNTSVETNTSPYPNDPYIIHPELISEEETGLPVGHRGVVILLVLFWNPLSVRKAGDISASLLAVVPP